MPKLGGVVAALAALLALGGVASVWLQAPGPVVALFLTVCVALGTLVLAATHHSEAVEREVAARAANLLAEVDTRRAVEALLRDSESRLLDAQRLARLGYWEWHADRDELELSPVVLEWWGLPLDALRLADLLHAVDPLDREALCAAHAAQSVGGGAAGPTRCEFRMPRPGGQIWLAAALHFERGVVRGVALDVTAHKLAELAASGSAARLSVALSSARMGTWEYDIAADRYEFDAREEALFGFAPGEFDGTPATVRACVHPEDRAGLRRTLDEAIAAGSTYNWEFRVVTGPGEPRWLQGYGRPLPGSGVGPDAGRVIGVNIDVTERKRAEESLRVSEANLADAQRIARVGSFTRDLRSDAVWWSAELYRLFGYLPGEVPPGRPAKLARVHPEDRARLATHMDAVAAGLDHPRIEFRTRVPGCPARVLALEVVVDRDADGTPSRLRGTYQDITERKEAEELLRASESRRAEAQRAARLGSWDYDPARGEFAVGEIAAGLLGLPGRRVTLDEFLARVPAAERAGVSDAIARAAAGAALAEFEHGYAHPDGPRHLVLRAVGGESGSVRGSSQDITEHKLAAEERRRIEARLQESHKLESLGVLAGGVAHDFNNLLTGVLGHANLARELIAPDSPLHGHLQPIERAAEHAAQLCSQMLTYAGKGDTVRGPLDLNRVVEESGELLRLALPRGARLEWELAAEPPRLVGDAGQLRQAVLNLVQNAAEALPPGGGSVTVATGTAPGGRVYLEVRDTGSGIAPADRARVFEPFYTSKFTGRGLGLSATQGIVRNHGGEIELESAPGDGSTFRLLLPSAVQTPVSAETPGPRTSERAVALLADDEPLVRRLAALALKGMGFRVESADGGDAAIELFRRDPGQFAVALVDFSMPGVGGRELLAAIRALRPDLPVVIMTGYDGDQVRDLEFNNQLMLLPKPFRAPDLTACLRRATRVS